MVSHFILFLRLLFGFISGKKVDTNRSWTTVTNSIELSFGQKKHPGLWAAAVHGIPLTIGLPLFAFFSPIHLHVSDPGFYVSAVAVSWAWIGPVLIWKYETTTLPLFLNGCRKVLPEPADIERLLELGNENILRLWQHKLACIAWIILTLAPCIYGFSVFYSDPVTNKPIIDWWSLLVVGAAFVYSYYTAMGFLLGWKSIRLIYALSQLPIELDPYDPDELGGMAFVGRFGTTTIWMFATGVLFFPILIYISMLIFASTQFSHQLGYLNVASIAVYLLFVLVVFFIPIKFVHDAIVIYKNRKMREMKAAINNSIGELQGNGELRKYLKYTIQRDLLSDLRNVKSWPIQFNTLSPIFVAIVYAAVRLWR